MHHEVQFAATKETEGIAELGMITKIAADTVQKLTVKDKNGETIPNPNKGNEIYNIFVPTNWDDMELICERIIAVENDRLTPEQKENGEKAKAMGFEMTPELMSMMGGFTVLRLLTMAGGMMDAKFTKEDLLALNRKLSRIKAPKK